MRNADPEANEIDVTIRVIVARVGTRDERTVKEATLDTIQQHLEGTPVELMARTMGDPPGPSGVIVETGEIT